MASALREVDRVEITVLVDNYTDLLLLQSTDVVKRPALPQPNAFLAEHGFSCLIKTYVGREEHTFLMDAGISGTCLLHNADLLKVDLGQVEAIILSHGHSDHFWGLKKILPRVKKGIPLYLHPEAFLKRRLNIPALGTKSLPQLDEQELRQAGADPQKKGEDFLLEAGSLLALGKVERSTDFEKGFPLAEAEINGQWIKDPFPDDRGVAVQVKGKGLVVIGGCSHAGIVNTVKHALKAAQIGKLHAVLGGFHLTGPVFEPIIGPTILEIRKLKPDFVVPMHCTGWNAINRFAQEMPDQFVLNSVGTTYVFQ